MNMAVKVVVYIKDRDPVRFEADRESYASTNFVFWRGTNGITYTFRHRNILYFTEEST